MWKCVDYFQEGQLCSPAGRDCVETSSMGNFECQAPCEGLYADVSRSETFENSQFNKIMEEPVKVYRGQTFGGGLKIPY